MIYLCISEKNKKIYQMATYRDLNLNRDLIEPVILEYSGGSEITKKDIPTGGFIYSFQTVKKTARIHVYYKNDGTTTLNNIVTGKPQIGRAHV